MLVPPEADGQRLDNFLLGALALPRTRVYRLIRKGEVRVNKGRAKPMQRLSAGDQVRIPPLREEAAAATDAPPAAMLQRLERAVLLRRPGLIIIDKPAGWASQPGTGVRWSLVEAARALW
ncbi:MAG: S4 domain-containing protein, partial [Oceanococcaceae bacterium]